MARILAFYYTHDMNLQGKGSGFVNMQCILTSYNDNRGQIELMLSFMSMQAYEKRSRLEESTSQQIVQAFGIDVELTAHPFVAKAQYGKALR